MLRLQTARTKIAPKMNKSFIPFVVDFKTNIASQKNKIIKITIEIKYNFKTPKFCPCKNLKLKGLFTSPFLSYSL